MLKLQFSTKNILCYLITRFSENKFKPVDVGYEEMALNIGSSIKTIQRGIKQLKEHEYIVSKPNIKKVARMGRSVSTIDIKLHRISLHIAERSFFIEKDIV